MRRALLAMVILTGCAESHDQIASHQEVVTTEGTPVTFYVEGAPFAQFAPPEHGQLRQDGQAFIYTPARDFQGSEHLVIVDGPTVRVDVVPRVSVR